MCGLSFSYFTAGPLSLDITRLNTDQTSVPIQDSAAMWQSFHYQYNTSSSNDPLIFEVFDDFEDLAEAPLVDTSILLALDNISITFCLPCDYDVLTEPGAIVLGGPESIQVHLRSSAKYQFNATTPICPNETLSYNIEAG